MNSIVENRLKTLKAELSKHWLKPKQLRDYRRINEIKQRIPVLNKWLRNDT